MCPVNSKLFGSFLNDLSDRTSCSFAPWAVTVNRTCTHWASNMAAKKRSST